MISQADPSKLWFQHNADTVIFLCRQWVPRFHPNNLLIAHLDTLQART